MHRSAFFWKCQNSQVRCHRKCQKLAGPRSRKIPKNPLIRSHRIIPINFLVCRHEEMKKMHRLAFLRKRQNLTGLRSEKMPKTRSLQSQKNAKNWQVRGQGKMTKTRRYAVTEKCLKLAHPWSRKNATNPQFRSHRNMPINFLVCRHEERKKCIGQNFCENAKNSLVCAHGKMPKTRRSAVTGKCQKLAGRRSPKNA